MIILKIIEIIYEYTYIFFRRWKWWQTGLNAAAGLSYTEAEWLSEWQSIVDMASPTIRNQTAASYQSLEEVPQYWNIYIIYYILHPISLFNKDDFILRILQFKKSTFVLDTCFNFGPCFKKTYNSYSGNYAERC